MHEDSLITVRRLDGRRCDPRGFPRRRGDRPADGHRQLDRQAGRAPRRASNQNFFNVEGNNNGTNASFGVVEFTAPGGGVYTSVNGVTLSLTESDASFTAPARWPFT